MIWTNQDLSTHTSTSGNSPVPDGIWESGFLGFGQSSAAVTFDQADTFPYFCRLHPFMEATVTVTP